MRVKVIELSRNDAYYEDRKEIVGMMGEFKKEEEIQERDGWIAGYFTPDKGLLPSSQINSGLSGYTFAYVKVEELTEQGFRHDYFDASSDNHIEFL